MELLGDLEFPEHIKPHLSETDLVDLDKRDKRMMLAVSVIDQRVVWCITTLIKQNQILVKELSNLSGELVKLKSQQETLIESNKSQAWQWIIIKWISIVALTATIGATIKKAIDRIWP